MLLNTHSYFSLRYGLLSPVELLQQLSQDGWQAAALTDINSSSAAMDFVRLSAKYGIRPVLGIDFRNGVEQKYVGIARSNEGFYALNRHLSAHLHAGIPFDQAPVDRDVFVVHPLHSLSSRCIGLEQRECIHRDLPPRSECAADGTDRLAQRADGPSALVQLSA